MSVQTVYSAQGAIQNAPTPATLLESGICGGKVRCVIAKYTAPDGNVSAGSTLRLAKLPKGARLLPNSFLMFEAGQNAGLGVRIGDDDDKGTGAAADDDRYLAAATPGASAVKVELSAATNIAAAALLTPYQLGKEAWIQVKTENQALTASKSIVAYLFYTVE
jgi:hypothetical protein